MSFITRPLVFNTICIFNTFKKYLYWVFSIHLQKMYLYRSILFCQLQYFLFQYFSWISFFAKCINRASFSYQTNLINLSYSHKNRDKCIHKKEFEFWYLYPYIDNAKSIDVLVFSILFDFQKYWSIGESILFLEVLSICIEILLKCIG